MKIKQNQKQIKFKMDCRTINDFRACVGGGHKATNLIKKWIRDYVEIENKKDEELLKSHRESLTPKQ